LIVCTEEFDATLLEQPALEQPRTRSTTRRGLGRNGSLNRLMQQVQTRGFGDSEPESIDDWQATEVSFTTVRPLEPTPFPAADKSVILAGDVKLWGHRSFRASARLTTESLATRDLSGVTLPRLVSEDASVSVPFTIGMRRSDPGLSVLELTDVNDPALVTPNAPLRMTVPLALKTNEHVVPAAYDGEFFLPLGRVESRSASETVIALDRLPPPLADRRSLTGEIKIFFQKIISKAVGQDFLYPILGAAEVSPDGAVKPIRDTIQVRDRVAKAKRILLFVHGIIGDTQRMVPSVQLATLADARPLASLYDLVLTFDYENLNTSIEENGRLFKKRLEAVGLGAGHGKTLDIVAHSMGGLVSRWYIEREGGNRVVRKLVMLGTPNGGSPWPRVADWANIVLSLGLNQLTTISWPPSVLGSLAALIDDPNIDFYELQPGAQLLEELLTSNDPGIPYVLLAGTASVAPAAVEIADPARGSLVSRLLERLVSGKLLHEVANPFFLGRDNDIAASLASMEAFPPRWRRSCDIRPVACDHLSYFHTDEGLRALAEAL